MSYTDTKDEDNLELTWGWWLADKDYLYWLLHKDDKKTVSQLELFEGE